MNLHENGQRGIIISCFDDKTADAIAEQLASTDVVAARRLPNDVRAIEVAVLVALVSSGSAAATAVLTGIFGVLAQRDHKTVRIKGSSGREIEVPADTPADRLEEYVAIARRLDITSIEVE